MLVAFGNINEILLFRRDNVLLSDCTKTSGKNFEKNSPAFFKLQSISIQAIRGQRHVRFIAFKSAFSGVIVNTTGTLCLRFY